MPVDARPTESSTTVPADLDEPDGVAEEAVLVVSEDALVKVMDVRNGEDDPASLCLRVEITGVNGVDYTYDLSFEPIAELQGEHRIYTQRDLTIAIPIDSVDNLLGAVLALPSWNVPPAIVRGPVPMALPEELTAVSVPL